MGQRYRLLALDVDGTLLDADGQLRPRTTQAVALAQQHGIRTVLCTGRRYRRALPIALELGLTSPLICNSGALMKDTTSHKTLWRADLSTEVLKKVLDVFDRFGEPSISFSDNRPEESDFLVTENPTGRILFDDYLAQNWGHAEISRDWTNRIHERPHFHVCAIGDRAEMITLETFVHEAVAGEVQTFVQKSPRYLGTMCEILRADASKWSALMQLAQRWNISADEICAIGDDMNDLPMIAGAGLGVAMGHSPDAVLAVADWITGDHHEDGVAMVIEHKLLSAH